MIYENQTHIQLYLNGKPISYKNRDGREVPYQHKIEKLKEYTILTDFKVKDKPMKFNRESGKSIPESNVTIQPDVRCKACFSWDLDIQRVRFRRINKYDRQRDTKFGHECKACGYLNTERD